ncbi:hypothetical protein BKA93DRAFT_750689 [Sparassis latifolia]
MAQHVDFTLAPHAVELDHIVTVVACALLNLIHANFYVTDKRVLKKNGKQDGQGPMLVILEPAVILDTNNKILTWYLSGILRQAHINDYNDATCGINQLLQRTVSQGGNFWTDADLFIAASSGWFNPGSLDISAGWFARGHNTNLVPSVSLRNEPLLNTTLCLINRPLYFAGISSKLKIQHENVLQQMHKNVQRWPSNFTAMGIIVNRRTIPHQDGKAWHACLDLLASSFDWMICKWSWVTALEHW